ncbi:putative uncharacterized protein BRD3OS isoform X1 [Erinaceus europaeus]|uniref:Uncharacterized protein n=1 Tax=Erinaceus europaeus TaxID=9365 RepID=A0ABM3Y2P0_ERIEU|nr:putative uncharacterized protein BRD3OS isoform X1 [Erinaceus europaeus]
MGGPGRALEEFRAWTGRGCLEEGAGEWVSGQPVPVASGIPYVEAVPGGAGPLQLLGPAQHSLGEESQISTIATDALAPNPSMLC